MKKKLSELAALRIRVLLLFAAAFIALSYIAYALFKFNRVASAIINDYQNVDEEEEEETDDDDDKEQPSANDNGQARQEHQTA